MKSKSFLKPLQFIVATVLAAIQPMNGNVQLPVKASINEVARKNDVYGESVAPDQLVIKSSSQSDILLSDHYSHRSHSSHSSHYSSRY
jgi:hypothetical protein